jgi:hypothetical protein
MPMTRSAAGASNDPFSFDGFGEPESPDAPHVWVRLPAHERPEGLDFIVDDGHGRPVVVDDADGVADGQAAGTPGLVKTGPRRARQADRAFDPEVFAVAVADRVVAALARRGSGDPGTPMRSSATQANRNLVTTEEFAASVDCSEASVFELLKLGLPSIKSRGLGRRILKDKATEWLISGGAARSRVAKKLAKAGRTKSSAEGGDRG